VGSTRHVDERCLATKADGVTLRLLLEWLQEPRATVEVAHLPSLIRKESPTPSRRSKTFVVATSIFPSSSGQCHSQRRRDGLSDRNRRGIRMTPSFKQIQVQSNQLIMKKKQINPRHWSSTQGTSRQDLPDLGRAGAPAPLNRDQRMVFHPRSHLQQSAINNLLPLVNSCPASPSPPWLFPRHPSLPCTITKRRRFV
jgi:hypothetical protein